MADMFDNGVYTFTTWAKQIPAPNGIIFHNRWLGVFNPHMQASLANRLLHENRITQSGQDAFMRGWKDAQKKYLKGGKGLCLQ